jgi:hypothetical protein
MSFSSQIHLVPEPPARFVSLSTLLAPGGLISSTFDPPLGRRNLIRRLRAAGVQRWKVNGAYSGGRGEVYYDWTSLQSWIARNTSTEAAT